MRVQEDRRALMTLWLSVKHLCQESSPLLRHLSAAPQLEFKLCSSFSSIPASQSSSTVSAADCPYVLSSAKESMSGDLHPSQCWCFVWHVF